MFFTYVCGRIKAVLLSFAVLFKRALCCFSRKRRNSYGECEILQSVNVVDNNTYATQRNEVSASMDYTCIFVKYLLFFSEQHLKNRRNVIGIHGTTHHEPLTSTQKNTDKNQQNHHRRQRSRLSISFKYNWPLLALPPLSLCISVNVINSGMISRT